MYLFKALLLVSFMLYINDGHAQIVGSTSCNASLGDLILNETFGAGTSTGPGPALAAGITNMQYVNNDCPSDGQYTIINYTTACFGNNWHTTKDHTGNANGYFMLINASVTPNDFYLRPVNGLCEGTTYQFSAWVMNMNVTGGILPNITFSVEKTDGTVLNIYYTGDIPTISAATWNQYGFYFTTPAGVSNVVLRIKNNAPGGAGNDLALDDIVFRPAGPLTTIGIKGTSSTSFSTCNNNILLYSTVANCYLTNEYQWQQSLDGNTWTDIVGANDTTYALPVLAPNTYFYRLAIASSGNIGNNTCRVGSNVISVNLFLYPTVRIAKQLLICNGTFYTLPSGRMVNTAGIYQDTVRTTQGCDSLITTLNLAVSVTKTAVANLIICNGSFYTLPSGKTINTAGTYSDTLRYIKEGCDSLITTVNLKVTIAKTDSVNATICKGNAYTFPSGKTVAAKGNYIDIIKNLAGCDSAITILALQIDTPKQANSTIYICKDSFVNIFPTAGFKSFLWNTGDTAGIISVSQGVYNVKATDQYGCSVSDTFNIGALVPPSVTLAKNIILCVGQPKIIDAGTGYQSYLWNNGSTTQTITIYALGTYFVMVKDKNGCPASDTTIVSKQVNPPAGFLPADTTKCFYLTVTLTANAPFTTYLWNTGSTANTITVKAPGTYSLYVTDNYGCKATDSTVVIDSACKEYVYVPSAFTPNGDGKNDYFKPIIIGLAVQYHFIIYTRWGKKAFESSDMNAGWDGNINGMPQQSGLFIWQLSTTLSDGVPLTKSGTVVLIR